MHGHYEISICKIKQASTRKYQDLGCPYTLEPFDPTEQLMAIMEELSLIFIGTRGEQHVHFATEFQMCTDGSTSITTHPHPLCIKGSRYWKILL